MGKLFGWVLRPQTHRGTRGAAHFLGPKNSKMANKAQTGICKDKSIDNGLMSSHEKFQPEWSKRGLGMAQKRMPLYGIIGILTDFLAHKLVKYQYFVMRPSLFVYYYQSTHSLLVSAQYI